MKKRTKEKINFISLNTGIIFIAGGLVSSAIIIPTKNPIIILPILILVIGAILALMGGLRKWG